MRLHILWKTCFKSLCMDVALILANVFLLTGISTKVILTVQFGFFKTSIDKQLRPTDWQTNYSVSEAVTSPNFSGGHIYSLKI